MEKGPISLRNGLWKKHLCFWNGLVFLGLGKQPRFAKVKYEKSFTIPHIHVIIFMPSFDHNITFKAFIACWQVIMIFILFKKNFKTHKITWSAFILVPSIWNACEHWGLELWTPIPSPSSCLLYIYIYIYIQRPVASMHCTVYKMTPLD